MRWVGAGEKNEELESIRRPVVTEVAQTSR